MDIRYKSIRRFLYGLLVGLSLLATVDACGDEESADPAHPAGDRDAIDAAVDGESENGCTRTSLEGVIDTYFEALTAHDPSPLKVASSVKYTEDGKVLTLGEGFWRTAGELLLNRNLLDPEVCGALVQAIMREEERLVIFGLRIKLADQTLTEIETLVVRKGPIDIEGFVSFDPQTILDTPQPEWEETVPESERSTREQLYAIADGYFDGFETSGTPEYKTVPFADDCNRWENGVKTTSDNCAAQFEAIPFNILGFGITNRRYPLADVENGIAVGFAVFSGIGIDFHMFKVRNGLIHTIQAVVGPYDGTTGWEEQEVEE